ncbi:MAG: VUT family protein, partial [Prochlorococcaceae cyanobacterium]
MMLVAPRLQRAAGSLMAHLPQLPMPPALPAPSPTPAPAGGPAVAPDVLEQRRELAFLVLAGLFLGTMGMLNILGLTRFLNLGSIAGFPVVVAVGALPYPLTFLCTDLISELWGEQRASQLV